MPQVDWSYHRPGCDSCRKTQAYLASHGILEAEQVNAKQTKYDRAGALALLGGIRELYVTRGRKLLHFDLKTERPDDDTIASLILGRSGTLRAPVLRRGKSLIVGFSPDAYDKVLS
ncbi:hypothetical protein GC176_00390 [bacterium]|nr:hypothetical protein [bacterium]